MYVIVLDDGILIAMVTVHGFINDYPFGLSFFFWCNIMEFVGPRVENLVKLVISGINEDFKLNIEVFDKLVRPTKTIRPIQLNWWMVDHTEWPLVTVGL